MEHRFLNGFMLFGAAISFLATFIALGYGAGMGASALVAAPSVVMIIFYYLSRFRKLYHSIIYSAAVFILVFASLIWIEEKGSTGPVIYVFFVLLVFIGMFFKGLTGWIMVGILVLTIVSLNMLENHCPS